jgi:hypothetical protein
MVVGKGVNKAWRASYLGAVIAAGAACSGAIDHDDNASLARSLGESPGACVAGIQLACQCQEGTPGVATCASDGSAFGVCACRNGPATGQPTVLLPDSDREPTGMARAEGTQPGPVVPELARGIRIAELAIYQTVKVPLMVDGAEIALRNAPVIVGKEAILRAFVEPLTGFQPRELRAELAITTPGDKTSEPLTVLQRVERASNDALFESTLNFTIPAARMQAGARYSVSLWETGAPASGGLIDKGARWPEAETELAALGARTAGPLRVVFVPYRYTADGSNRLPAMDDAEIGRYEAALRGMYPASEIEFQTHAPVDFDGPIGPTAGWADWLEFHCSLRADEAPDPKVLYYGTIAPRRDFRTYGGGIVGISPVPSAAGNYGRCSVGIGYSGFESTMVHELGHALGLEHAPCGTDGGPYPYEEAKIGVWGLVEGKTLVDPTEHYDVMSYCDPTFISDYNYQRLFERIRYLNLQFDMRSLGDNPGLAGGNYRKFLVDETGNASPRGSVTLDHAPGGVEDSRALPLLDASGTALGAVQAFFFPFSERAAGVRAAGVWLVPEQSTAAAVRLPGGDVSLR